MIFLLAINVIKKTLKMSNNEGKKKYKNLKHNIEVVCNANNELIVLLQRAQKSE